MSRTIKVSNISQAEDYINRQNNQINNLHGQLNGVEARARNEAQQIVNNRINQARSEMDAKLNNEVTRLESEMEKLDKEHRKALKRQADDFYNEINRLSNKTDQKFEELEDRVNRSFVKHQQQIRDVQQRVNLLYEKEANEKVKAEKLLRSNFELLNAIDARSQHQKFAPGKLDQIRRRIEDQRLSNDPSASLIANARNITYELWELEEEVLKEQLKHEFLHSKVLKEAEEVLIIMRENRLTKLNNEGENNKDKNKEEGILEVNYWTNGKYQSLEEELLKIHKTLIESKNSIDFKETHLKEINKRITKIKEEQYELVDLALKRGILSEERVKISEDIINTLLDEGFAQPDEPAHNYLGGETTNDQREGVFAILKNGNGTEITIIINPNGDSGNKIIFQRNDNNPRTEEEVRNSMTEIAEILESNGIKMDTAHSPSGTGDVMQPELADPSALARIGINKELKKRLGL